MCTYCYRGTLKRSTLWSGCSSTASRSMATGPASAPEPSWGRRTKSKLMERYGDKSNLMERYGDYISKLMERVIKLMERYGDKAS